MTRPPTIPASAPAAQAPAFALRALPSAITLLGVFGGFLCLVWAPTHPYWAASAIIGASLCDMIDGRVARLTGTSSAFGVQLDSLADLASFGVAPAFLAYHWGIAAPADFEGFDVRVALVFLFVAACAIRLARFNLAQPGDLHAAAEPGFHIIGLPTPVAALTVATLVMSADEVDLPWLASPSVLIPLMLVLSGLMVSRIPFPSYKRFRSRPRQLAFFAAIASGLTLLIAGGPGGAVLHVLMLTYVIVGGALGGMRSLGTNGADFRREKR